MKEKPARLSLSPLKYNEAVSAILKVKPEPKKLKKNRKLNGGDGDKPRRAVG